MMRLLLATTAIFAAASLPLMAQVTGASNIASSGSGSGYSSSASSSAPHVPGEGAKAPEDQDDSDDQDDTGSGSFFVATPANNPPAINYAGRNIPRSASYIPDRSAGSQQ